MEGIEDNDVPCVDVYNHIIGGWNVPSGVSCLVT